MDELARTRTLMEQMNVGVLKYLEKKTGVCKIELDPRKSADRSAILSWEQKNTCFLPEDLKNFYLTSDGFQLTWCVKMDNNIDAEDGTDKTKNDGPIPIGKMNINRIGSLAKIGGNNNNSMATPSLADLDCDSDLEDETSGFEKPTFDSRCKVFELDSCQGFGKVCLVYRENKSGTGVDLTFNILGQEFQESAEVVARVYSSDFMIFGGTDPKIEIWFLDRALRWHYITDSFMAYYRLMIMHLGLPQWQYAFTDIGLSQQAKQWFNMYAPLRFELDSELTMASDPVESNSSTTSIDVGKVFKGKSDKKKPVPAQTQSQQSQSIRKKPTPMSAKGSQQAALKSSGSSSQLSGKK